MSLKIPPLDLRAQFATIRDEVYAAIHEVVESQGFVLGPKVEQLEREVAAYCGCAHAVGMSSGTDALLAALMEAGVGPGDEVLTSPYTFFATVGVIARLGARPVFVDIDPATFNMAVDQVADKLTPRVKAIVPVHLFGQCADMGPLLDLGAAVPVIEDAAQAIGAEWSGADGRAIRAGSAGRAGCLSFYPAKNLGAFGDAGMVVTQDQAVADRLRALRVHGSRTTYHHEIIGGNFRLDAIQAAVLLVKLRRLDEWTSARQAKAARYDDLFVDSGLAGDPVHLPPRRQPRHVYNQYVIRCERRDELRKHLADRGIGSMVYYPLPLHLQPCFAHFGHVRGDFPESERAAAETLALPIYPELPDEAQREVVEAIRGFYRR